ncbi:MAG: helix-hairpin-helix domain-containing protein [Aeromicrobium sp.]
MTDAGGPRPSDLPRSIGRPATNALAAQGITSLEQVAGLTEAELLALHGVGPKAVRLLREALAAHGRVFGSRPPAPD